MPLIAIFRSYMPWRWEKMYPGHILISPMEDKWWEKLANLDPETHPIAIESDPYWPADRLNQAIESVYPKRFKIFVLDMTSEFEYVEESGLSYPPPTVMELVQRVPPPGWRAVGIKARNELKKISDTLRDSKLVLLPEKRDLFRAFHLTPLNKVRVVIVGQDPYPNLTNSGEPQAMGLSFSVRRGVTVPPSLVNIFKEIASDIKDFKIPSHGDLTPWAQQGVLLLNMALTVPQGQTDGPHAKAGFWMPFHSHVFTAISEVNPKCIYVLWGAEAGKVKRYLGSQSIILEAAHPSPRSANRGFFGCKHFSKINAFLDPTGREPTKRINWQI